MQGIAALPTDMPAPAGGASGISTEEAATLGRLLMKVSDDEVEQLRELSNDLKGFSEPELRDFLGGVDYLMQNAGNYKRSVANLIQRGIVEPGDLPGEYVPTFFSILRQMIMSALEQVSKQQGFAKGGLVSMAEKVRKAGRHGDTMLAHITPREAQALKAMGGAGTINPATGLPEFKSFWSKVGGFLKKAAPVILPVALSFIPGIGPAIGGALGLSGALAGSVGSAVVGAVGAGVGGLIAGQKPAQALTSALLGGVGGFAMSQLLPAGVSGIFGGGGEGIGPGSGLEGVPDVAGPATLNADASGAYAAPGTGTSVKVPMPTVRPPDLASVATTAAAPAAQAATTPVAGGLGNIFGGVGDFIQKNPMTSLALAGGAGLLLSGAGKQSGQAQPVLTTPGVTGSTLLAQNPAQYGFNPANFQAQQVAAPAIIPTTSPAFPTGYYGQMPRYYAKDGGHINGPGTGTSDDVPAMLSDGEFVMTAKAVRGAGEGDRIKGAKKMYKLMNQLEKRA
jgi:hypothetical protein